jgi:hypothetical protein
MSSTSSSSSGGNSSYNGGSCNNVLTGGVDLMIKLEDFRVYIVLLHGLINTQSQPISSLDITKVPLMTQPFPASITNLACISAAPTGIVNIGGRYTLYTFEQFINAKVSKIFEKYIRGTLPTIIKNKLIESIQDIENKAHEVTDKKDKDKDTDTKKKKISSESSVGIIFHKVCNYCFRIVKTSEIITNFLSKIANFVSSALPTGINFDTRLLDGKILGYSLKDMDKFEFNICKSVFSSPLQGGAERVTDGGGGRKRAQSSGPGHPQNPLCAVSTDLFVLLLDNLRESLKKFDVGPFTEYCKNIKVQNTGDPTQTQKYNVASNTIDKRFRNLSILKGFGGSPNIQYVNKDMMYNHSKDNHLGMGLIELSFKLDHNNKVRCETRKLHPFDVIKGISAKGKVSSTVDPTDPTDQLNIDKMSHWIKMQDCIDYLHDTGDQNPNKTVLLIDLSCSGYSGGVASTAYACGPVTNVNFPGGGGRRRYHGQKSYRRSKKRSKAKSRAYLHTRSNKKTILTSVNSKYRRNIRRHITRNKYKIKK